MTSPSTEPSPSASGLAVTSIPVHNGEVGVGYLAVTLGASNGTAPYTWSVATGSLPPGLTMSTDGVITGNNTTAGQYAFSVKVTDSTGATATGSTKIGVFPPLAVSQPCAQVCDVGVGCTTCGRFGSVSGGAGPYTYKLVSGSVPSGMTMNGFALQGPWPAPAIINQPVDVIGPPLTRALYTLAASVTDDFGVTKTVTANWLEFFPIRMNCTVDVQCTSVTNNVVDTDITYAGGSPEDLVTVKVIKACFDDPSQDGQYVCTTDPKLIPSYLPPSWTATANNNVVSVYENCTGSCTSFYGDVFIVLIDHGACVAPGYVQSPDTDVNIDV